MVELPANGAAAVADSPRDQPAGSMIGRNAPVAYDAFISYSHAKDKPIATALQAVVQKLGKAWLPGSRAVAASLRTGGLPPVAPYRR